MAETIVTEEKDTFVTGARRGSQEDKMQITNIPTELLMEMMEMMGCGKLKIDKTNETWSTMLYDDDDIRRDLIPEHVLDRVGALYGRGSKAYGDRNWEKGIPLNRIYESLFRHLMQWHLGDTTEDHLSAVIWNAIALTWTEEAILIGDLPQELADAGILKGRLEPISD